MINEADALSRDAQQALRRTMEKYMGNLRLFLVCNALGRIMEPLQSRCVLVRVAAPDDETARTLLTRVAAQEHLSLPSGLIDRVLQAANGNLRKALLSLDALAAKCGEGGRLDEHAVLALSDWEALIDQVVDGIVSEQNAARLLVVRGKLYELLTHCIPPTLILRRLALGLADRVEPALKTQVLVAAAQYDHRMGQGAKPIFHLEAFVAKFMSLYKRYLMDFSE